MAEEAVNDIQALRAVTAEAQANGDSKAANAAYAAELSFLEGQDTAEGTEANEGTEGIESFDVFSSLSENYDEETISLLRSHWVDDESAQEGLALGQALVADHPELNDIASEFGMADHPMLLKMAEAIARKSGYTYGPTTGTQKKETQMETNTENGISREAFSKGMRNFDSRIELAQSEGNSRLANEIYASKLEWIGSVKGNQTIVGGRNSTGIRNV